LPREAARAFSESTNEIFNYTAKDLEIAVAAHKKRAEVMRNDFLQAANEFATDLGCDTKCLANCNGDVEHCFPQCGCGNGIVVVKPVNTAAIIESIYGDVAKLNEEQLDEIDWSLNLKNKM
jgi:hypothetical protein